jgi:ABC-type Fe3+/spermidine/putrescine transport system ATPase subunit
MLDLVRLSGLERRRPRQLSGGQQQRVALARALVTRPRVLLLDEPLAALDKRLRQQMQIELRQIQREVGITTVFVTHDQEEAMTLSDRIAICNDGKIVQVGPPQEVYERPETAFAAGFLGDANFFAGRSAGRSDGLGCVELEGVGSIYTRDPVPTEGTPVTIAVRPEKFALSPEAPAPERDRGAENRLSGVVTQAVYSGNSITYKVAAGPIEITIFEQNRRARPLRPEARVILTWDPAHSVTVRP